MIELRLRIGGMHCANCARNIETTLAALPGVGSAVVNFAAETLAVAYEPGEASSAAIIAEIERLGFRAAPLEPPRGELRFGVQGMHCVNCAANLEKTLAGLPGVTRATVNFAGESGDVAFDPALIDQAAIFAAVTRAGFTPRPPAAADAAHEARRELRWLLFSAALSLPVMLTMFGGGHDGPLLLVSALLATIVQFSAGLTFYRGAWYALRNRNTNMDVLVALGISAAWGYSILALGGLFGHDGGVFFETSALLITFIRFGKWLEARAKGRASSALRQLLALQPEQARRLRDGSEEEIATAAVQVGDRLLVKAGERIPVDGVIESGEAAIDEAMLTGEAAPVAKGPGETVSGGTINRSGLLTLRATAVGEGTVLARIVRLVEEAQADKAPIQRLADAVSGIFVPTVVALALLTLVVWLALGADFLFAFKLAIAVVVIACPCALGLATPTAIMVGSAVGLSAGILFKRATALETVARLDLILFDKTGTLTTGLFSVTDLRPCPGMSEAELLRVAAAAEGASTHPLAQAVTAFARSEGITAETVTAVEEIGGHGLACQLDGATLLAGNRRLLTERGIDLSPLAAAERELAAGGKALIFIARDNVLLGLIALADTIKPEAAEALARLKARGIRLALVTGDHRAAAQAVADRLAIDEVAAEVLPGDKLAVVKRWQGQGFKVGMVGDGINDAPALAQAEIGIAIGSGTDVAKETGDIVLVRGDLRDVERAIRLGRATLSKIKQNLFWAFFYNVIGIPLAAGALYPAFHLVLKPEFAGLAMAFSSVSVVTNSLLLRRMATELKS